MTRISLVGALVATVLPVLLGVVVVEGRTATGTTVRSAPDPAPRHASARPATSRAVEVLRAWDGRRAAAWASGDAAAVRALYVDGSAAGRRDARTLASYAGRGLAVRGMRMQLLSAQVLLDRPRLVRLRVTDRLAGAVVVRDGVSTPLPADRASTRTLTLRLVDSGWRMVSVASG